MSGQKRKVHSAEFKAKVGLEALQGKKTINEIGKEHGVHPVQVSQWKRVARMQRSGIRDAEPRTSATASCGLPC